VYKTCVEGSYFGEIEIIQETYRQNSVKTEGDCELLTLNKNVS
jgi:hypothetical protein